MKSVNVLVLSLQLLNKEINRTWKAALERCSMSPLTDTPQVCSLYSSMCMCVFCLFPTGIAVERNVEKTSCGTYYDRIIYSMSKLVSKQWTLYLKKKEKEKEKRQEEWTSYFNIHPCVIIKVRVNYIFLHKKYHIVIFTHHFPTSC